MIEEIRKRMEEIVKTNKTPKKININQLNPENFIKRLAEIIK